ncbi:hypothetical protein ACVK00_000152 [Burkholderia sp. PvR073]|uniref:hypothetical protein n=1 Tax=Burkholderia TaxID=32008 RepID=UPI00254FFB69|nr:hypothetical protein [Burkholderia sp. lyk4-R2A-23]
MRHRSFIHDDQKHDRVRRHGHRAAGPPVDHARFVLLTVTIALAMLNGWFIVYGLNVVTASAVADHAIAAVIRDAPSYLVLAFVLLIVLVSTVIRLVKRAHQEEG